METNTQTDADEVLSEFLSDDYSYSPVRIPSETTTVTQPLSHTASFNSLMTLDENTETSLPARDSQQFLRDLNQQVQRLNAVLQQMTQELRHLNNSLLENTLDFQAQLVTPPRAVARIHRPLPSPSPLAVFRSPMPRRIMRAAERAHRLAYRPQ